MLSVKGGCLQGLDWSRAIHIWTKSAMVPIPESAERFAEEPNFPAPGPGASPSNTATTATTPAADTPASAPSPAAGAANVNDPGYAVSQEMLDQPSGLEGSGGWKDEDGLRDSDLGYHYHDDRPVVGGVAEGGGVSGACELSGR